MENLRELSNMLAFTDKEGLKPECYKKIIRHAFMVPDTTGCFHEADSHIVCGKVCTSEEGNNAEDSNVDGEMVACLSRSPVLCYLFYVTAIKTTLLDFYGTSIALLSWFLSQIESHNYALR